MKDDSIYSGNAEVRQDLSKATSQREEIYINGNLITPDMLQNTPFMELLKKSNYWWERDPSEWDGIPTVSFVSFRKLKRYLLKMKKLDRPKDALVIQYVHGKWSCLRKK